MVCFWAAPSLGAKSPALDALLPTLPPCPDIQPCSSHSPTFFTDKYRYIQVSLVLFAGAAAVSVWVYPGLISNKQPRGTDPLVPTPHEAGSCRDGPVAAGSLAQGCPQSVAGLPRVTGWRSSESQNKAQSTNYLTGNYFLVKTEKWVIKTILNRFH